MLKYLKAAFWVKPRLPLLGNVPVNVLAVCAFVILGFGHPAFWLLGMGLEMIFLYSLVSNSRFRTLVDGKAMTSKQEATINKIAVLLNLLSADDKRKISGLEAKVAKILDIYLTSNIEVFLFETNKTALEKICYVYLKILVAKHYLVSLDIKGGESALRRKIEEFNKALTEQNTPDSLRISREATLKILEQRLANLQRREESLAEIESDLTRIEAQVDLALEKASMQGKPETISANVDLMSHLFDGSLIVEAGSAMSELNVHMKAKGLQ